MGCDAEGGGRGERRGEEKASLVDLLNLLKFVTVFWVAAAR